MKPGEWIRACRIDELVPERGVAVLLPNRDQAALFRTHEDQLFAVSNFDPYSEANVISRGIVGTRGDVPTVASPMYKQVFDLTSGRCLTEAGPGLRCFEVVCVDGQIWVNTEAKPTASQPSASHEPTSRLADVPAAVG